ncbi:hypothetical protein J2P12_08540, partial [Candidatus Bathyarchaeota archaeon]|nr:hypothetical protein [Candidatus Bathyarchaeota archaeon]
MTYRNNPAFLSSNFMAASDTNSSNLMLDWTEGPTNGPFNVTFASIPIGPFWSPYSSPGDPWDGNGLAPYGQYFANLGEYVSPSTGMLTVRQADLDVPGRGLSLEIARVYTEPHSFLNNNPYGLENYPWAPLGNGWQLNFPWMNGTTNPTNIHLWNGEGYRIPSNFWSGSSSTWENHQGENFRLTRNADGSINLYDKTGTTYYFNTTIHRLAKITDSTGNNMISFSYNNNIISCITDSVGRAFVFSYSGTPSLLQTISQVSGNCASPGSTIRTVSYGYSSSQSLTSETDPIGRKTYYSYNATASSAVAPWLLSRVTYPTSWLTNYTYGTSLLGTQATIYRIKLQITGPSATSAAREFVYAYNQPVGDQVTNSTVMTYNATAIVSYTLYAFSSAGMSQNVTDYAHNFVHGLAQRFGVNGEIPREITLVSPTQGFTNYYSYDLWGNLIYSRSTISSSPSLFRESFSSYYNDGLPQGFRAFQDTFGQNNGTASDNPWNVTNGYWMVKGGVYNGTETSGLLENMVSSNSIGTADLSLQARVYIGRQINSTTGVLPR